MIVYNSIIPFKGFKIINLCGILFVRKGSEVRLVDLNHEKIHTKQMIGLLIIPFYLLYVIFWIWQLVRTRSADKAYRKIPFELEAYSKQRLSESVSPDVGHYSWLRYIKFLF